MHDGGRGSTGAVAGRGKQIVNPCSYSDYGHFLYGRRFSLASSEDSSTSAIFLPSRAPLVGCRTDPWQGRMALFVLPRKRRHVKILQLMLAELAELADLVDLDFPNSYTFLGKDLLVAYMHGACLSLSSTKGEYSTWGVGGGNLRNSTLQADFASWWTLTGCQEKVGPRSRSPFTNRW